MRLVAIPVVAVLILTAQTKAQQSSTPLYPLVIWSMATLPTKYYAGCLEVNSKDGKYSSNDEGVSAERLSRSCGDILQRFLKDCALRGNNNCGDEAIGLAEYALKKHGK